MRREAEDEEIVQWIIENSEIGFETPARDTVTDEFVCGSERAQRCRKKAEKQMNQGNKKTLPGPDEGVELQKTDYGLRGQIKYVSDNDQPSLEEAMDSPMFTKMAKAQEINMDNFEVDKIRAGKSQVTMKVKDEDGVEGSETKTNHNLKVEWKRKAPEPIEMALRELIKEIPRAEPRRIPAGREIGDVMAEISIFDLHWGMLAYAAETGDNYDTKIAGRILDYATSEIIKKTEFLSPEYYLFPFGNDWFHVNDATNLTPAHGNRLDVDSRLAKIIKSAKLALLGMVKRLAEIAPVKMIWVPGNHDPQTSFWMMHVVDSHFHDDERIQVDLSPEPTWKIHEYGMNLVAYFHECPKSREKEMPGLFADVAGNMGLWKPNQHREIHRAHLHKEKVASFDSVSSYGDTNMRTIPSMVGTEHYARQMHYIKTNKTSQIFIYDKDNGLDSIKYTRVPREFYE